MDSDGFLGRFGGGRPCCAAVQVEEDPRCSGGNEPPHRGACPGIGSVRLSDPGEPREARKPRNSLPRILLWRYQSRSPPGSAGCGGRVVRFIAERCGLDFRIWHLGNSGTVGWLDGNLPATIMPVAARKRQAGVAQLVEHHVANVVVEGSSPFTRSFLFPGRNKSGRSGSRPAGRSARQQPSAPRVDELNQAASVEG